MVSEDSCNLSTAGSPYVELAVCHCRQHTACTAGVVQQRLDELGGGFWSNRLTNNAEDGDTVSCLSPSASSCHALMCILFRKLSAAAACHYGLTSSGITL
jgi:hypothetical protein